MGIWFIGIIAYLLIRKQAKCYPVDKNFHYRTYEMRGERREERGERREEK